MDTAQTKAKAFSLVDAIISLARDVDLPSILTHLVNVSTEATGCSFAAINVLDAHGVSTTFIQSGGDDMSPMITGTAQEHSVLAYIPADTPLILNDVSAHPGFQHVPENHPPISSFFGISVQVGRRIFGQLYLANKPGGFTDKDRETIESLVAEAGIAIEKAQMYEAARRRERWLDAGQKLITLILSGTDEEEILSTIAARAREVAHADTCVLVLPSIGDRLVMEIADGLLSDQLVGTMMPEDGRSNTVLTEGIGMIVDSLSQARMLRVDVLRNFGPALYTPMQSSGQGRGVMLFLRRDGQPQFDRQDLAAAETFASRAALALQLAESRQEHDVRSLLEERERIARDLHDLAIQQLFATGMQLDALRLENKGSTIPVEEFNNVIGQALDNIDQTVQQIRAIVHNLRAPDAHVGLVERLRREASMARSTLGWAPSLVIHVNGEVVGSANTDNDLENLVDDIVSPHLEDDIVAVVREGLSNIARHAEATSARVAVSFREGVLPGNPGRARVEVSDDGIGLPPVQSRSSGLSNLAARAGANGGLFTLTSNPDDAGAILTWQVPLKKESEGNSPTTAM